MIEFKNLGVVEYQKAYQIQLEYFNRNIENKNSGRPTQNIVLYVEHPHVYTLGKHGDRSNLLISDQMLKQINATFVRTDRGGDITYHGYGQQVIYPIFDLDNFGILIKKYIWAIEEVIIRTLKDYGIEGKRLQGAPGIWLYGDGREKPEKICAIGVRVSRGVTMHGLAFNINTDLRYFEFINPCGFTDKGVTSLEKELGHSVPMEQVREKLTKYFNQVFQEIKTEG
jgi:lipoyl(octanoyl) transferase